MGNFVFIGMMTKDVAAARAFYEKLGFEINKDYSTDENIFVVLRQNVQLILSTEEHLRHQGEDREFADATKVTEASVAISVGSREEVDKLVDSAIAAGGTQMGETVEEPEINLYARAFADLDGHKIDVNHMPV